MATTRTATAADLDAMRAFERSFVGHEVGAETFRSWFSRFPELFVLCEATDDSHGSDGLLLGAASGYADRPAVDDGTVVLAAIGVRNGYEGNGIGRELLAAFEAGAREYGDAVSVAAADDVEGFYRACGYEPARVLVQVPEADLPADYASHGDLRAERSADGTRFLYYGVDEYRPSVRVELQNGLGGTANTILREQLDQR
ncbi:GNAT family N-acetyltransferase [Haloarchaeobius iranensis]|uniref:N-acetylglutamate synthase, GNAT family n=1 Tax=Haloarchaeobius iranensis TaxID=996166 RepID=A0A1G9X468_9EURY|nr:GNAT family N-acetyltransferase [Haloarchaeobius iranensis]SDM91256.1 N-acetylglutamate synthase, GNAT family [Haloarchaeobius iranensis]